MSKKQTKPNWNFWVGWMLTGLFAFLLVFRQIDDVDIWWHMHAARAGLSGHSLVDQYLYAAGPFAGEQLQTTWLGDLLFYFFYSALGPFGLVLLTLICLGVSIALLAILYPKTETSYWILLCAASYQWLLPRNALFGLPCVVLVIFLYHRRIRFLYRYLALAALFFGWSWLHPSFLLGLILVAFYEIDRWFNWQEPFQIQNRIVVLVFWLGLLGLLIRINIFAQYQFAWLDWRSGSVLALGCAFYLWRPQKFFQAFNPWLLPGLGLALCAWFTLSFRRVGQATNLRPILGNNTDLSVLQRGLQALNNTIWQASNDQFGSLDFLPPFNFLGDLHVWTWLLISLVSLGVLIKARTTQWRLLAPWLLFNYLACGYQRLCGLASLMGLLILLEVRLLPVRWVRVVGHALLLGLGAQLVFGFPFGLYPSHVFGTGSKPFPSVAGQWLDTHLLDLKCYTTVENGGYLGWIWQNRNGVFLDGFYAGHTRAQLSAWQHAVQTGNLSVLQNSYPFELAIVGFYDRQNQVLFEDNAQWLPLLIEPNAVVYGLVANSQVQTIQPQIKIPLDALEQTDHKQRMLWALATVQMEKRWQQIGKSYALNQMEAEQKTLRDQLRSDGLVFARQLGY